MRTPKYQAIATDLATKIRGGELAPGSALPPQRELSQAYGVTLVTLRQALQQLEDDGLLSQQPGRGTFVAEPRAAYRLDSLRGFAEDLRAQGQTVSTQILSQAVRRPPAWVTGFHGPAAGVGPSVGAGSAGASGSVAGGGPAGGRVAAGAPGSVAGGGVEGRGAVGFHGPAGRFLRLERLRLIAGRPAVHQLSWIRGDELAETDFSGVSLYAALADRGVVVHRASETVRPGVLDAPTAELLGQPAGTPVFVSDRITFGLDDVPLVFDRATILGTALEIRTERAATGLSMQWSRPFS
ncbi:GntR family transcriptional regulator [Actinoplanes sp. NPDC051411]|uniref:GntR family transcriptional regulator n=1 Tax=Actinoplanes sp. NPDC051411 TaxID=3155522 RepID=UPI00341BC166